MHTICFSPAKLQEENIRLTLSRKIGAFENEEIIAEIDDFFHFSEAEKVTNLQFEFGKTKNRVDQILKELNYQRSREGDFREKSQEVNDAVLKFAFIQVISLKKGFSYFFIDSRLGDSGWMANLQSQIILSIEKTSLDMISIK